MDNKQSDLIGVPYFMYDYLTESFYTNNIQFTEEDVEKIKRIFEHNKHSILSN